MYHNRNDEKTIIVHAEITSNSCCCENPSNTGLVVEEKQRLFLVIRLVDYAAGMYRRIFDGRPMLLLYIPFDLDDR